MSMHGWHAIHTPSGIIHLNKGAAFFLYTYCPEDTASGTIQHGCCVNEGGMKVVAMAGDIQKNRKW